jgi:hypothetical protein
MTTTRLDAIKRLSDLAHAKLPEELHGRLERGTALVLHNMIEPQAEGTYRVMNATGTKFYTVNGSCDCDDHARAPEGLCKHRLGVMMLKRVEGLLTQGETEPSPAGTTPEASDEPDATTSLPEASTKVPAHYLVLIQGKPFIKFAGLLQMAHEQHLVELSETWLYNDTELSLAHAVAIFEDGRRFEGSGDAPPQNVTKKVVPHFRRVALTRAKSRALRDALNIDMVAVEELGEEA